MKAHRFTHANTKQFVYIMEAKIFSWFAASDGSTYVVGDGQSIIPVLEKPEEVTNKLGVSVQTGAHIQQTKENKGNE